MDTENTHIETPPPATPPNPKKLTRAEASRLNGAKSRGPVTPEGKARSSQNALKHGLASRAVVLFNESHEEYDALLLEYRSLFQPMDQYEADRVTDIVNARWRIRRIQRFETAAVDLQLDETAPILYEKFASIDIVTVETASFQDLARNSRVLDVIHDYESRYYRILEKAERDLHRYRQTRSQRPLPPGNEPNKPSSPSFWNRFLPTLLLSVLLSLCLPSLYGQHLATPVRSIPSPQGATACSPGAKNGAAGCRVHTRSRRAPAAVVLPVSTAVDLIGMRAVRPRWSPECNTARRS